MRAGKAITTRDPGAAKRHKIAQTLRKAIVTGKYQPGQQLPTRVVLEAKYKVSPETLQRSFDELKEDGFLRAQRRGGTFVVDYPPHLHRYALALGSHQKDLGFPHFFNVLAEQATDFNAQGPDSMVVYYGVTDPLEHPGIIELTEDIERHRLAGVIYCGFIPDRFKACRLPQVVISSHPDVDASSVPFLSMSNEHYVNKAVQYFAQQGCKRLGVIAIDGWQRYAQQPLIKACRESGITIEEHWFQLVGLREVYNARRITQLLMHPDHRRRPDALLIADDNIIEHVKAGLEDVNVSVPKDVTLVAHANFPAKPIAGLPMRRLGYNARDVIQAGVDLIGEIPNASAEPHMRFIEPYFEDEIH
jgi:DNA-binding LacI/PurR family transcriptional regulator